MGSELGGVGGEPIEFALNFEQGAFLAGLRFKGFLEFIPELGQLLFHAVAFGDIARDEKVDIAPDVGTGGELDVTGFAEREKEALFSAKSSTLKKALPGSLEGNFLV